MTPEQAQEIISHLLVDDEHTYIESVGAFINSNRSSWSDIEEVKTLAKSFQDELFSHATPEQLTFLNEKVNGRSE